MRLSPFLYCSFLLLGLNSCSSTDSSPQDAIQSQPTDSIINLPTVVEQEKLDSTSLSTKQVQDSLKELASPLPLDWESLSDLSFDYRLHDSLETYIDFPVFGVLPQAYNGLEVQITGYMIPVAETGNEEIFILSAFPYSQCFFCGQAGLESILDIQLKEEPKRTLELDERLTFKGRFRTNNSDLNYLIYILDDAELVN